MKISDLTIDDLRLDVDSGLVELKEIQTDTAKINCDSGLVKISKLSLNQTCDINVDSGKLQLKDSITDKCGYDIKCDTGITKLFGAFKISGSKHWTRDGMPMFYIRIDSGMCTIK